MPEISHKCAVCSAKAFQICAACSDVYYCTKEHQKSHWPTHKSTCKAYKILHNDVLGRYLVSARNLKPGDVILHEKAIAVGPKQGTQPLCLNCYSSISETSFRCADCNFPFCTQECAQDASHADECVILSRAKSRVNIRDFTAIHPVYECVTPLRCLLLKGQRPGDYQILRSMESHNEIRRGNDLWQVNETNTVHFLRDVCQMANELSEEEIHFACGVLEVNTFEIRTNRTGNRIRGVFPLTAIAAHGCIANTKHVIHENSANKYEIIVYASVPIQRGQMIFTNYTYSLEGTKERRKHLRESKYFDCSCPRCSDPTEGGTYLSALKCQKCSIGNVLPICPLDNDSSWNCDRCCYKLKSTVVDKVLTKLKAEVEAIDHNDVAKFEIFLKRHGSLLHTNHFLYTSARHSLSQLYGRDGRYLLDNLTGDLLERKVDICKQLLAIADIIEPGLTRLRGVTLYELHAPMLLLTKKQFESNEITDTQLKARINQVRQIIQESIRILSTEDPLSSEGSMASAARTALQQMDTSTI